MKKAAIILVCLVVINITFAQNKNPSPTLKINLPHGVIKYPKARIYLKNGQIYEDKNILVVRGKIQLNKMKHFPLSDISIIQVKRYNQAAALSASFSLVNVVLFCVPFLDKNENNNPFNNHGGYALLSVPVGGALGFISGALWEQWDVIYSDLRD